MSNLKLEIVSPEKIIFQGEINLVEVPGKRGRFTLLRGHAPIISSLNKGDIRVQDMSGNEQVFSCDKGYLECENNRVTILMN